MQMKTISGASLYFNKRSGILQYTSPPVVHEEQQVVDEQKFEYFQIHDGTEICTYANEHGQRFYMNWDTQVCNRRNPDSATTPSCTRLHLCLA